MGVFLILLTYVKPLDELDRLMDDHHAYLDRNYQAGHLLVSGRREPRTGGVIMARATSLSEIHEMVAEDPFIAQGAAEYEVIEFIPSKWASGVEAFAG